LQCEKGGWYKWDLLVLGACRRSKQDLGGLTFLGANSTVHVVKVSAQVDLADAPVDLSVVPALAVVPAALPVVAAAAQVNFADAAAAAAQAELDELDECFGW
jgi:hypothetical protein